MSKTGSPELFSQCFSAAQVKHSQQRIQRCLLITCLFLAWLLILVWELPPLQLPTKNRAPCTCCLWQLSPGRPQSSISSSCLNQRHHIPNSSMPVTSTSQRHSLTEWPSSSVLAVDNTVLCFCLWLMPTALMLGLAHTHAHILSPYVS